ncbi:unnamed protein product, partial [Prorocentrum cordatum]
PLRVLRGGAAAVSLVWASGGPGPRRLRRLPGAAVLRARLGAGCHLGRSRGHPRAARRCGRGALREEAVRRLRGGGAGAEDRQGRKE